MIKQPTVTTVSPVVTTRKKREKKRNKKKIKRKRRRKSWREGKPSNLYLVL